MIIVFRLSDILTEKPAGTITVPAGALISINSLIPNNTYRRYIDRGDAELMPYPASLESATFGRTPRLLTSLNNL